MIGPRRIATVALLSFCILIPGCAGQSVSAFSPYNGKISHDAPETLRFTPEWTARINPNGIRAFKPIEPYGIAVTRNGTVVIAAFSGKLHGIDAATGAALWTLDLEEVPGTPPTAAGNMIYIGVTDGRVVAINARTGTIDWTQQLEDIVHGQPTIAQGVVYVETSEEALVALDAKTGAVNWTYRHPRIAELDILGGGQPSVIKGAIYAGFSDGSIHRFDKAGNSIWSTNLAGSHTRMIDVDSPPIGYKDLVVAVSHSGGVYALHQETGRIQWSLDKQGVQTPLLVGDTLILTTTHGHVLWVNASSGIVQRDLKLAQPGLTAPMRFTKDSFVVGDSERGALVLNVHTPHIAGFFETTVGISGQMSQYGNMLFVLTNRGMAYGLLAHWI